MASTQPGSPHMSQNDQSTFMSHALSLARLSPCLPTNFRVGAVLISAAPPHKVLSTGYTLELPGNTHAEQVCFLKLAAERGLAEEDFAAALPDEGALLYTTVEPCIRRLSGNKPCVERIVETKRGDRVGVKQVYVGVKEPETFVGENQGAKVLKEAGIAVIVVAGLEDEILKVATEGHVKEKGHEKDGNRDEK